MRLNFLPSLVFCHFHWDIDNSTRSPSTFVFQSVIFSFRKMRTGHGCMSLTQCFQNVCTASQWEQGEDSRLSVMTIATAWASGDWYCSCSHDKEYNRFPVVKDRRTTLVTCGLVIPHSSGIDGVQLRLPARWETRSLRGKDRVRQGRKWKAVYSLLTRLGVCRKLDILSASITSIKWVSKSFLVFPFPERVFVRLSLFLKKHDRICFKGQ